MALDYVLLIYFALGAVFGWCVHGLLLQLAYRMGIVEYKGRKQGANHD
ncbi:hypothetical protein [Acidovorax sp. HMWF018]|nr:hypothetical protein [Acidovorax sp. HMWF018]